MSDLESKIKEYREMKRLAEEAQSVADSIADELKAYMTETNQQKVIIGEYKLSFTECTRKDIDKQRLASEQSDIYNAYIKEITYKRFLVS